MEIAGPLSGSLGAAITAQQSRSIGGEQDRSGRDGINKTTLWRK
jgi:hypothetical protein